MEKQLYESLKDILDCFWDMSPLEYARSRGLKTISDETGDEILQKARLVLSSASQPPVEADPKHCKICGKEFNYCPYCEKSGAA